MKTRKMMMAALIAAVAFTSCSQDEDVTLNDPNIVRFNSSIDGMTLTRATLDGTGAGSFNNGDKWGVCATIATPASMPLDNAEYTVGSTTFYWDNISTTAPVTFSACYPYNGSISDPGIYPFNAVTATNPDLLIATPVAASKGETVNLTFTHAMHKLVINFYKSAGVPGVLSDLKFTLLNMKSTAKVDILTGSVNPSHTTGAATYSQRDATQTHICVAPQDLTAGDDWVQIELAGKTYTCKVPANLNPGNASNPTRLESGKQLNITLTLKVAPVSGKTSVSMATAISAWGTMQDVSMDVNADAAAGADALSDEFTLGGGWEN